MSIKKYIPVKYVNASPSGNFTEIFSYPIKRDKTSSILGLRDLRQDGHKNLMSWRLVGWADLAFGKGIWDGWKGLRQISHWNLTSLEEEEDSSSSSLWSSDLDLRSLMA